MMHTSYKDNKDDMLSRLRKMEGQVRGIQQMVDDERYCLDVVQQINALTAAAREVALLAVEAHVQTAAEQAALPDQRDAMIKEIMRVLGKTLRP